MMQLPGTMPSVTHIRQKTASRRSRKYTVCHLGKDGVYVHPYDHYRVDYDDPNCINEYGNVADPDDPFWPDARIVESEPRDMVMIVVDFDLGYDSPFNHDYDPSGFISVKGLNSDLEFSGNEYNVVWTYREDIDLYAWGLTMPKEAVLIEAKTSMLTTYEGEEFVDTYDGFYIHWGAEYAGTVASTATADVDFELKSNTLFDIKSKTDRVPGYAYDNRGVYVFDNGKISYDLESCRAVDGRDRDGIAIQGDYNPGAWVMTALDPVQGGLDDTYRYFFTIKKSAGIAKYVAASNENGNKFLIELTTKDDNKEYWYYDAPIGQRSLSKVIVDNAESHWSFVTSYATVDPYAPEGYNMTSVDGGSAGVIVWSKIGTVYYPGEYVIYTRYPN